MNELMNTDEAADALGVSARRVRQLIDEEKLPARQVGRDYVIEAGALEGVRIYGKAGRPPKVTADANKRATGQIRATNGADTRAGGKKHVAAVHRYPELETLPTQKHVLMAEKVLDSMPQGEREELLKRVAADDVEAQRIACGLPPMPPKPPKREDPQGRWLATIEKFDRVINGVEFSGGIEAVVGKFSGQARRFYLNRITNMITNLKVWQAALKKVTADANKRATAKPRAKEGASTRAKKGKR
jgi:excisionase family DNA binding protein